MARRIFEKYENFNIQDLVLPYESFVPFYDVGGFKINPENKDALVAAALPLLEKKYESLCASDFLMYARNGNRSVFEDKYFPYISISAIFFALLAHSEKNSSCVIALYSGLVVLKTSSIMGPV